MSDHAKRIPLQLSWVFYKDKRKKWFVGRTKKDAVNIKESFGLFVHYHHGYGLMPASRCHWTCSVLCGNWPLLMRIIEGMS